MELSKNFQLLVSKHNQRDLSWFFLIPTSKSLDSNFCHGQALHADSRLCCRYNQPTYWQCGTNGDTDDSPAGATEQLLVRWLMDHWLTMFGHRANPILWNDTFQSYEIGQIAEDIRDLTQRSPEGEPRRRSVRQDHHVLAEATYMKSMAEQELCWLLGQPHNHLDYRNMNNLGYGTPTQKTTKILFTPRKCKTWAPCAAQSNRRNTFYLPRLFWKYALGRCPFNCASKNWICIMQRLVSLQPRRALAGKGSSTQVLQ